MLLSLILDCGTGVKSVLNHSTSKNIGVLLVNLERGKAGHGLCDI